MEAGARREAGGISDEAPPGGGAEERKGDMENTTGMPEVKAGTADHPPLRIGDNGEQVCLLVPSKRGGKPSNAPQAMVTEEGHVLGQPLAAGASGVSDPSEDLEALLARQKLPTYAQRLTAFQLYAAGERQASIALQLGVSPQVLSRWKIQDHWDLKLDKQRERAVQASEFAVGNLLAEAVTLLRSKVKGRILELELLCSDTAPPQVRLGAIKLWLELATKLEAEMLKSKNAVDNQTPLGTAGVPTLEISGV